MKPEAEQQIVYNRPFIVGKELYNIAMAVQHGHLSGDGMFTRLCHEWLENKLNTPKALLTHSCTSALEMAAMLCDIKPGDEVIMPSFTFVSTANAFVLRGAIPVFVDVDPDSLNISPAAVEAAITSKTRAIVCVHYAGIACDMDKLLHLAEKHDLFLIEDAAQALMSKWKDKYLGTIGHLGCLSFHETKNIISGEGGALLINDPRFIERAEIIREKGTNRSKFFRGEIDKYTWVDIGSSFLPSELIGAFLYAQLEEADKIIDKRKSIFNLYLKGLTELQTQGLIKLPVAQITNTENGHIFYILTRSLAERSELIEHLKSHAISAVFHYVPLHSSSAGKKYGRVSGSMTVTNEVSDRLLRLPLYYEMTDADVARVINGIHLFYSRLAA